MRMINGPGSELEPRRLYLIVGAFLLELLPVWLRAHRLGGNIIVRCRDGHLFTTLWIPGFSVKSVRLGFWRLERCPVGHHWSVVTPAREDELSDEERRLAAQHHDLRLP